TTCCCAWCQLRAVTAVPTERSTPSDVAIPQARTRGPKGVSMGIFSKDIKTMDDLFLHSLQDIYYAEQQITKALPKMIEKATNADLKAGFRTHLEETKAQ